MTALSGALETLQLPSTLDEKISNFILLFDKWNQRINLSAARTHDDIALHIVDCLHVVPHLRAAARPSDVPQMRVLDVGSGGGLPSVIAALCLPDVRFTALEPVHKKHAFLRTAARELSLANLDARAERLDAHPRRDYDAAMSRATFELREWLLLGLSFVRPGGLVLGFEATLQTDLPDRIQRSPYDLADKERSIVSLRRPS